MYLMEICPSTSWNWHLQRRYIVLIQQSSAV